MENQEIKLPTSFVCANADNEKSPKSSDTAAKAK